MWAAIKSVASDVGSFLDNLFHNGIVQDILAIWSLGLIPLAEHWTTVWNAIEAVVTSVEGFFTTAWAAITSALTTAWNAIASFFTTWWSTSISRWETVISTVESIFSAAWTSVENTATTVWNAISAFFTAWWSTVTANFRSGVSTVESVLSAAWTAVSSAIQSAWNGIIAFFQGVPGKIVAALSALGGDLTSLGSTIMNDFLNGVKAVWTTVEGWFSGLPSAILKALGIASPPQWALDAGKHIMNGLLSSFAHGASDVKAFFVGLASDITGPLKAAWSAVTSAFAGGGAPAGSGVVAAWITAALNAAGAPASWLPLLEVLVSKESGGNPAAVNPISVMGEHACVPLDVEILTRDGWKTWDQLAAGDETIGYNPAIGQSEWTRVTAVHYYEDAEVLRIGNAHWHADVTPNHRWWSDTETTRSEQPHTVCPECGWLPRGTREPARGVQVHRNKIHGISPSRQVTAFRGEFVQTSDLGSHHRIRLAAYANTGGIPGLSVTDCAVLGWLTGDGHVRRALGRPVICPECGWEPQRRKPSLGPVTVPSKSVAAHRLRQHGYRQPAEGRDRELTSDAGWDAAIYQAKPAMVEKVRALLADVPHTEHARSRGLVKDGSREAYPEHTFTLSREYATDLLKRADWASVPADALVLAMSPQQRGAWLTAMIDAEGHRQPGRREGYSEFTRIAQKDGPVQEAIKLAVYLEGWQPSFNRLARTEDRYLPAGSIGMRSPHAAVSGFKTPERLPRQATWCPTTELGTRDCPSGRAALPDGQQRPVPNTSKHVRTICNSGGRRIQPDIRCGGRHPLHHGDLWQPGEHPRPDRRQLHRVRERRHDHRADRRLRRHLR